ncbi:MAG TPA: RNA repair transcriptional activator RtcR [Thermoanaerobaculia bacterium]|nr:RNA repair transcriptional activator RtcR [Thermoanaerobaculia bacterium]
MKTVAIGLLGTSLDLGKPATRWERWRPSVSLCQQEDLLIDRFELLHPPDQAHNAAQLAHDIASVSPETQVVLRPLSLDNPWDFEQVYGALHELARTYPFDPESEDYLVHITTGTHVAQICMFLLTESRHFPGRLVQTSPGQGARYVQGAVQIVDLDLSRYDAIASRFREEQKEAASFLKSGIATRNAAFNRLIDRIEQVAIHSREPLLLMGPTGAGKSRLARRIFELKRSRHQVQGEFVEVNCATIRGEAAMSALFGHVKGSFTGALRDRPGLLRAANRGVLFLDEIGELGLDEQAMLLRALEEKVFLPLGGDREVKSDFMLIAGTNRNLGEMVRERRFRDDLLARINLWTFVLPGLHERLEDIEPNLDFELEQFARRSGANVRFSREARERFLRFATSGEALWPGNFRDLNGAVVRMATLARGGRITNEIVDEEIARLRGAWHPRTDSPLLRCLDEETLASLDPFDRVQLEHVVEVARRARSLSEAGRMLFSASRQQKTSANDADRLRKYLSRFGLDWKVLREE